MRLGIQTPEVIGIARHYRIPPLSCNEDNGRVDNIARVGSAAKFATCAGKRLIKRNQLHAIAT